MAYKELMDALSVLHAKSKALDNAKKARGPGCGAKRIEAANEQARALRRVLMRYEEITRPRKRRTIADTLVEDEQE